MSHKSLPSMLFLLAVAMIALMGLSPARPAWRINAWSLQYTRHVFSPNAKHPVGTVRFVAKEFGCG